MALEVLAAEADPVRQTTFLQEEFDDTLNALCPFHKDTCHNLQDCTEDNYRDNHRRDDRDNLHRDDRDDQRREEHHDQPNPDANQGAENNNGEFQHIEREVNIIIGGPKAFCSNRKHKLQRWEVHFVSVTPVQYLRWSEMPITFFRKDHWVHLQDPRSYSLVVCPTIDRVLLSKVLIDVDSGLNIIFIRTLKCMDFNLERLIPYEDLFYGIVHGKGSYPIGRVILLVTFGTPDNYHTEHLPFKVANFKTSYHAIFGRQMLARFMEIPNHTYLILKKPTPNGILSIFGDAETSYKCDTEAMQLTETLEYSANATMMLTESK
nr:uncharacterized protein LOC117849190 [Setaria viridis]